MSGSARIARGREADAQPFQSDRSPAPAHPIGPSSLIGWSEPRGGLWCGAARDAALFFLTLGFHHFWAKVRLRRRVWSAIRLDGSPLTYTGTVQDLLRPALVALGMLAVMALGLAIAKYMAVPRPKVTPSPWRLLVSIPLVFMIGIRLWRAKAYLLDRTVCNGVAGRLEGSPLPYAATHLGSALALPFTLGWVLPWRQAAMLRRVLAAIEIGGRRVEITGPLPIVWRRFWVPWVGIIAVYLGAVLTLAFTMGPKITGAVAARSLPALSPRDLAIIAALSLCSLLAVSALSAWHRIGGLRAAIGSAAIGGRRLELVLGDGEFVRHSVVSTALKLASLGSLAPYAEARAISVLAMSIRERPRRP